MATSGKLWEIRLVDATVDKQKFWEITIAPPEAPGIAAPDSPTEANQARRVLERMGKNTEMEQTSLL
jgi:hypothetical protein